MEGVRSFLESSTIHGLTYISTTRRYVRLFWILVVIAGFSGAVFLIKEAFDSWSESPIKTNVETVPISEMRLPKVTVCPPKNTFTSLNYDLTLAENVTFTEKMKFEMFQNAVEIAEENVFSLSNLNKLNEKDRFDNWYHGYTEISLPSYDNIYGSPKYLLETTSTSGAVNTQFYGEKFRPNMVETNYLYDVNVYPPDSVRRNENMTLHFKIEKVSLTGLTSRSKEYFKVSGIGKLDANQKTFYANFTPPPNKAWIQLWRDVNINDLMAMKLDVMPGFRLSWWYTGDNVTPHPKFKDEKYRLNSDFVW